MRRGLVRVRDVILSLAIGTSVALFLFSLVDSKSEGALAMFFLLPGAAIAGLAGAGAHDLAGLLLYIVGNVIFYSAVPMLFFVLIKLGRRKE